MGFFNDLLWYVLGAIGYGLLMVFPAILCYRAIKEIWDENTSNSGPAARVFETVMMTLMGVLLLSLVPCLILMLSGNTVIFPGSIGVSNDGTISGDGIYYGDTDFLVVNHSDSKQRSFNIADHNPLKPAGTCEIRYEVVDRAKLHRLHELMQRGVLKESNEFAMNSSFSRHLDNTMQALMLNATSVKDAQRSLDALSRELRLCGLKIDASLAMTFPR